MKEAGVLLHISSLPSKYGIGSLGKACYEFIDYLALSGNKYWQILPINPTGYKDSPYQPLSTFAFNEYLIDLELLKDDGMLAESDICCLLNEDKIRYDDLFRNKIIILAKTYQFKEKYSKEFTSFVIENTWWLDDYALFRVIKKVHGDIGLNDFPCDLKFRNHTFLQQFKEKYCLEIDQFRWYQYLFYRQWQKMRDYAKEKGIKIIGDMPIYVAYDSSDVWANPENYLLNADLSLKYVAGVPADAFSEKGQLWGNPIYNYEYMSQDDYSWFKRRIKYQLNLFDMLRIDHFRGVAGYYRVDANASNALNGKWCKGPGFAIFKDFKDAKIIAEDLGVITKDVCLLLEQCGYPGMNVMMFDLKPVNKCRYFKRYCKNRVLYTGTHDNDTLYSWFNHFSLKEQKNILQSLGIKDDQLKYYNLIYDLLKKNVNLVIIPLQDYFLLDNNYRMNVPSTNDGNWTVRIKEEFFTMQNAAIIYHLLKKAHRC